MSSNNNNNNDKPKPSGKGKEREQDANAHGWGETIIEDWTPTPNPQPQPQQGPTHVGPSSKRKRCKPTRAQKKKRDNDADDAANDAMSDDSIMRDLAGEAPTHAEGLRYMLTLAEDNDSDIADTIPGNDDVTMGAPPSLRSESAERNLKPPPRAEPSSSASSRMNKRPRERSPERTRTPQRA